MLCKGILGKAISIHALREEGDSHPHSNSRAVIYFYPRPPRGGRHKVQTSGPKNTLISIHALREEGDALLNHGK